MGNPTTMAIVTINHVIKCYASVASFYNISSPFPPETFDIVLPAESREYPNINPPIPTSLIIDKNSAYCLVGLFSIFLDAVLCSGKKRSLGVFCEDT